MTEGISKEFLMKSLLDKECTGPVKQIVDTLIGHCTELDPWLPIESAPKDGRYLRLYDGIGQIDGRWFSFDETSESGYWAGNDTGLNPTHWQELPEDPKE